ncbi:MAG TPA: 5-formyltetrahydrofolate cyclo-ligase [Bacillales bacterium]|nr:5-formyltetrahydrofolate cyclo-ligase [Bacillales bacterium]
MVDKKKMRQQMINQIRKLNPEERLHKSHVAFEKLTALPEWQEAKTIGLTMSTLVEIDTEPLIRIAWEEGKRVAVPKADPKAKTMDFREIRSLGEVEEAFAGIREPILDLTTPVRPSEIDLLVVPGLVFNEKGYRIGFGGGFYDRFLVNFHGKTVSLAFDFQVTYEIPTESFDRTVEMIVTNERVIRTGDAT